MTKTFFALLAVLLAGNAWSQKIFDVRDYGAKGDGVTPDTAAIQKALNDCGKAGGGIVRFPAGTYLSQPISLRSKTTVEVDPGATLLASTNQNDFMKDPGVWYQSKGNNFIPFIRGSDLTDVTFTGGGTIDGSGSVWWGEAEKAREKVSGYTLPRPNLIVLERCRKVRLENITLQNSPKFNFGPDECEDVVVTNVTILNPARSANTDGIDPSNCKGVFITKCRIDTGDDNIAIKSGRREPGREFACEDITVTDCTFLHGHGMSIGSETSGGVGNVLVKNCVFEDTENGIRIKSQRGKGGRVENIRYQNIRMTKVDPAVTFTCYYMYSSAKDPVQKPAPQDDAAEPMTAGTPIFRNIHISNLTATCTGGAGTIIGLPESKISDVTFDDVKISATTGMKIENAAGIEFSNSLVTAAEGQAFLLKNAQVDGTK
ncbi:MAG TPA: glycoside hydrolase family 28 protein [Verrucomicrobiae bacterium]|jgi:polygalacturonase